METEINKLGKMSHREKKEHGRRLMRICRKTEIEGEALLSDDPLKVETS
jgi:hypothetical protein